MPAPVPVAQSVAFPSPSEITCTRMKMKFAVCFPPLCLPPPPPPSPCRPLSPCSERGCCAFRFSAFPRRRLPTRRDQICSRSLPRTPSRATVAAAPPAREPLERAANSLESILELRKREDVAVGRVGGRELERARCANQTNQGGVGEPACRPASAGLRATCRSLTLAKRGRAVGRRYRRDTGPDNLNSKSKNWFYSDNIEIGKNDIDKCGNVLHKNVKEKRNRIARICGEKTARKCAVERVQSAGKAVQLSGDPF